MTWIPATIAATAMMAVVSIADSHFISKRFPSFRSFLVSVGSIHFVTGLVIMTIHQLPEATAATTLAVALASSIARVTAALLMLRTMRSEEVTRVIPVVNTFPIFVAILAVPILGEVLGPIEWLAIFITVSGAVLISVNWDSRTKGVQLQKSFAILMVSSILFGVANIGTKYALDDITYWSMYGINAVCIGGVFLLFSLRSRFITEVRHMEKRNRILGQLVFYESIAVASFVMIFWAMEQGPVSLVSTIVGTRPAFVFIFALGLSIFFPAALNERLTRGAITTKIISIGLIIGGVTLLTSGG